MVDVYDIERILPGVVRVGCALALAIAIIVRFVLPKVWPGLMERLGRDFLRQCPPRLANSALGRADAEHGHTMPSLHKAACLGDTAQLQQILAQGGDPDARNQWAETPLHFASATAQAEAARILVQYGADVSLADCEGETPLHRAVAATGTHDDIGFDSRRATLVAALLQAGADAQAADALGRTPVLLAQEGGSPDIIALLEGARGAP